MSRVDFDRATNLSRSDSSALPSSLAHQQLSSSNFDIGFRNQAHSTMGAAFLSMILMNPLDMAKVNLDVNLGVCSCVNSYISFYGSWSFKRGWLFTFCIFF